MANKETGLDPKKAAALAVAQVVKVLVESVATEEE